MKKEMLLAVLGLTVSIDCYIEQYSVDQEIAPILAHHADEIQEQLENIHRGTKKHGVWQFDWLPGYYVKYGLARIAGMEKIQRTIERCNLTALTVADKRVFPLKRQGKKLSNKNCAIVIETVQATSNPALLTLDEVTQLCTIMHETGYISMTGPMAKSGPNYIRIEDGRLCLIDTESTFDHSLLLKGFLRFIITHDFNQDVTQEALKHIFEEIKRSLRKKPAKTSWALKMIKQSLARQSGTPTWDYHRYIERFCNQLKENQ